MIFRLASEEISLIEEIWLYIAEMYLTPKYRVYENITVDYDPLISPAMIFLAIFAAIMISSVAMIFTKRTLGRVVRRLIKKGAVGASNAKTLEEIDMHKSISARLFINRYTLSKAVRCCEEDAFYGIEPEKEEALPSSIGIENTEKIKLPFWRRKQQNPDAPENDFPCGTRVEEEFISVASGNDPASHLAIDCVDAASKEETGETASSPYKDSYEASLVMKKKYKRRALSDHFYIPYSTKHMLLVKFDKKGTNPLILPIIAAAVIVAGVLVIKLLPFILSLFDSVLG